MSVVDCNYISRLEHHMNVAMRTLVTSGSPGGVMVRKVVWNRSDVGSSSIPILGNISHFHHAHDSIENYEY